MRSIILAIALGLVGTIIGAAVAYGAGQNSATPLWMFSGATWGAILGAILGGTQDIVWALRERGPK